MKDFFQVTDIDRLQALVEKFKPVAREEVGVEDALDRVLAQDFIAPHDLPGFDRATMDGFAVPAASTFGASEGSPAYLTVVGSVGMGETPAFTVGPGQAARIATGGMLPPGTDSVVMIEHTDAIDGQTIEVYRSVAPGQHRVARDEDASEGQTLLSAGTLLRPQEIGVLSACGRTRVTVYRRPVVGIISSGDEVVPVEKTPAAGQVRDVNSHTLAALVSRAGGRARLFGIVADRFDDLLSTCRKAVAESDMVLISGGSSVGTRDLTIEVLSKLPRSSILVHGISMRPGKPTILAQCGEKAFWGLPGHVTSAMVVFMMVVRPFIEHIGGRKPATPPSVHACLTRNLASVQGRVDYVRVRLSEKNGRRWAEPVLGASGLIRTMVAADGLVAIPLNSEGLDEGSAVEVLLI